MGDPRRRRRRQGAGEVGGWVWWRVIRSGWQESHEVKAAGVEAGDAPGPHHQDLFGVVVQGGDTCGHADGEGQPGHTGGDRGGDPDDHRQGLPADTCSFLSGLPSWLTVALFEQVTLSQR